MGECREDAVGGRVQLNDDDSEMNESIVQCRDVAVGGRMQGDEHDASDSQNDGDDATNGVWQYDYDDVFGGNENEMKDVVRVREGDIIDMNMCSNVYMRSIKSRTVSRDAGDESGATTNVGGSDVMRSDMTYVRGTGTRPIRSSASSLSSKRRRTMTTPLLRRTRRTSTGKVSRRRPTSTLRGGPGTSLFTGMSSAALPL